MLVGLMQGAVETTNWMRCQALMVLESYSVNAREALDDVEVHNSKHVTAVVSGIVSR